MVTVDGAIDDGSDGIYDVMIGANFIVNCMLNCPTATLMWSQDDVVISNSPSTMVTLDGFTVDYQTNGDGEITGSMLTRTMAELSDYATYQCGTTVQTIQSNDMVTIAVYGK